MFTCCACVCVKIEWLVMEKSVVIYYYCYWYCYYWSACIQHIVQTTALNNAHGCKIMIFSEINFKMKDVNDENDKREWKKMKRKSNIWSFEERFFLEYYSHLCFMRLHRKTIWAIHSQQKHWNHIMFFFFFSSFSFLLHFSSAFIFYILVIFYIVICVFFSFLSLISIEDLRYFPISF